MKAIVFDAEANGLYPDKFHCLSYQGGVLTDYENMRSFLLWADVLVGHNIIRWDIPNLERVLGIKVKARLIDTLAISWYLDPNRIKHGLESYGEEFGIPKPFIGDWENQELEVYAKRCLRDVEINQRLWDSQWKRLLELYESEEAALRFLAYLSFKMDCAREQEEVRWKLDIPFCESVLKKLTLEQEQKMSELQKAMPKVPIVAIKNRPAKRFKMNGQLSVAGQDWRLFCANRGLDEEATESHEYIKDHEEPNPRSPIQVKDWLYSFGWRPETFMYKRDKVSGDLRSIPQITQDKTKGPGLCKSVLKLMAKEPAVKILDGLAIVNHRIGILSGFLENQEDGYLKAEIDGLTNTLRFKHRTIVNLPGVQTLHGADIRKCLTCDEDEVLCGSDMSGLEDRLKQHFIYVYDPEYVKEMNYEGYDPHLDLAVSAGAVSVAGMALYKKSEKKDPTTKAIRHTYKQGNYACQYGAKPPRIALTVGCTKADAQKIYDAYWKRNWAINAVVRDCYVKVCNRDMWLYNPISKFWYSLRAEKDKFSTLVQGSAVYCFDTWVNFSRKAGVKVCGQFHDEVVSPIKVGQEKSTEEKLKSAIDKTNNKLKLNRELGIDIQFGHSYEGIH